MTIETTTSEPRAGREPLDVAKALDGLRSGREAARAVAAHAPPGSLLRIKARLLVDLIDNIAGLLTGKRGRLN